MVESNQQAVRRVAAGQSRAVVVKTLGSVEQSLGVTSTPTYLSRRLDIATGILRASGEYCLTNHQRRNVMDSSERKSGSNASTQKGGIGYVLMWFLGVPIPILIIIALLRGCA